MEGFDVIDRLTASVKARLLERAGFGGPPAIDVLTERLSDLESKIRAALSSKLGICVLVSTPEIEIGDHQHELVASVSVQISENIVINQSQTGSRIKCSEAALRTFAALLGWAPDNGWSPMVPMDGVKPIRLVGAPQDASPILTYEVALLTRFQFSIDEVPDVALSGTP